MTDVAWGAAGSYRRLFAEYFRAGAKLTAAPRPALRDSFYDHTARADEVAHRTLPAGEGHRYPVTEQEPVWEAVERHLRGLKSVPPLEVNRPRLVGVGRNPGLT